MRPESLVIESIEGRGLVVVTGRTHRMYLEGVVRPCFPKGLDDLVCLYAGEKGSAGADVEGLGLGGGGSVGRGMRSRDGCLGCSVCNERCVLEAGHGGYDEVQHEDGQWHEIKTLPSWWGQAIREISDVFRYLRR